MHDTNDTMHDDIDQNLDLAFTEEEFSTIKAHRNAVSSFDEKMLLWIQELGRLILAGTEESILDDYLDDVKETFLDEDGEAQLIVVAVESVDHWLESDPTDGEILVQDDAEHEYKIYLSPSELATEPRDLAPKLIALVETDDEEEDDEE